jgi:hypothetical protein
MGDQWGRQKRGAQEDAPQKIGKWWHGLYLEPKSMDGFGNRVVSKARIVGRRRLPNLKVHRPKMNGLHP